jgi:ParB family chromosome partitioning protein
MVEAVTQEKGRPMENLTESKRRKTAFDAKRLNAFSMSPDDIVIIGVDTDDTVSHPLWDARAFLPLDEAMVRNIMTYGVIEPITIMKDGERAVVVDGRRRVLHAREAKRRQEAAGEVTVLVPAMQKRGSDGRLFGIARSANAHRQQDDLLTNAANAQRMLDMGEDEESIGVTFGVEVQTVKIWLKLLDLDTSVKTAVKAGEMSASAASRLASLPRDEQRKTLEDLRAKGELTTKHTTAVVKAKKNGSTKTAAPGKRVLHKLIEGATEHELDPNFVLGLRFAMGDLNPMQVKGLTAALRALGVKLE